jgi:hypothetical protein
MDPVDILRALIIWARSWGHGASFLGNCIVGSEEFHHNTNTGPVTTQTERARRAIHNDANDEAVNYLIINPPAGEIGALKNAFKECSEQVAIFF